MRGLAAGAVVCGVAALSGGVVAGAPALAAGHHSTGAGHGAKACGSSQVAATLDLADTASGSTSPAGAVIFRDTSKATCSLVGAPTVTAAAAGGAPISLYEQRTIPRHDGAVVLTPGKSGKGAAASITWSDWTCGPGSYSLNVRFAGWSSGLKLSSGTRSTGFTCDQTGQTLYVGAVGPLKG